MQFWATVIIVFLAMGYASWRIYEALKPDGDPCKGCQLKKNCQKFGHSKEK
jgi:hypothetical protein